MTLVCFGLLWRLSRCGQRHRQPLERCTEFELSFHTSSVHPATEHMYNTIINTVLLMHSCSKHLRTFSIHILRFLVRSRGNFLFRKFLFLTNPHDRVMLPSRLYRNTGIPPALRSLLVPHPSLPATISVQLRMRLGVLPQTVAATSPSRAHTAPFSTSAAARDLPTTSSPEAPVKQESTLENEPRYQMTFTCAADGCSHRSTHQFTKRAYEKGIVLIQCPSCKNRCVDFMNI
jgi:mitochondrial protein import protein ZIM17